MLGAGGERVFGLTVRCQGTPSANNKMAVAAYQATPGKTSTISKTDNDVDPTDGALFTFIDKAIGVAPTGGETRLVVVAVDVSTAGGPATGVTIGGVAADLVVVKDDGTDTVEFWQRVVATGTTATIVVTLTASVNRCGIGVFRLIDVNTTVLDTGTNTGNPGTVTLQVKSKGVVLAAAMSRANTSFAWTNLTEAYDEVVEGSHFHTGASEAIA